MKKIVSFLAIVLAFVLSIVNVSPTFAESVSSFSVNVASGGDYNWLGGIVWGQDFDATYIRRIEPHFTVNQVTGNYATLTSTFNLVASSVPGSSYRPSLINDSTIKLEQVVMGGSARKIESSSVTYAVTDWLNCDGGDCSYMRTFTFYVTAVISGYSTGTNVSCYFTFGSDTAFLFNNQRPNTYFYFENDPNNSTTITFGTDLDTALLNSIAQNQQQTTVAVNNVNQSINETNDWLKDDTAPSADTSSLSGAAGWLPAGPVDSILTLPTQLLGGIVNAFTNPGSCSPLTLPLPWVDYDLQIPCLRTYLDMTGFTPIWDTIGGIIGAFIIWETLKWLYEFVDKTLSFREDNSSIWGGL